MCFLNNRILLKNKSTLERTGLQVVVTRCCVFFVRWLMTSYPALSFENWHLLWPLILAARSESIDFFEVTTWMFLCCLMCSSFSRGALFLKKMFVFSCFATFRLRFFFSCLFPVSCLPFVLCASQFVALFACLHAYRMHKRTNMQVEDSAALGAGFQGTRGFVARFNAQGLKADLRTHPDTATFSAFVDSVNKIT